MKVKSIPVYRRIISDQDTIITKLELNQKYNDSIYYIKEKYIMNLKKENSFQENKISKQKKTNTFMGIGLVVSIILGIIF
jgi:hypothetical protein